MYNNFTEEARKVLVGAKEEMIKLKHPYVGSEHLLLSILKDNNDISEKLNSYMINYDNFKNKLVSIVGIGKKQSECFLYTPLLKRVMENAIYDSKENNNGDVTVNHLFSALLEEGEGVAIRILISMNIDVDDLYKDFVYKTPSKKKNKKLTIESIGIDLTKKARNNELDPVIGRDNEIKRVIEILCRRKKNNPILIGPAGVGKTAIVEELSRLISSDKVPYVLKNKKVINLDMSSMVAGTKYRGEFEERVNKVLKELEENDDIIVFIDEIHTLVGAGGAEGAIDASNIFKPALARNKMRLIGATTTEEYKKFIEKDKALDRRFQKVEICEPNEETLKEILMKIKDTYSSFHKVIISEEIIDYIIDMSKRYIKFRKEPDKSIDILDEVGSKATLKSDKNVQKINNLKEKLNEILNKKKESLFKNDFESAYLYKKEEDKLVSKINRLELSSNTYSSIITKKDVDSVISSMCNIPIYELNDKDIKEITDYLKTNVIGQNEAINKLINVYKRIKLGISNDKCNSILLVGSRGTGKTLLAKLFSNKVSKNVIKIDGSEYSDSYTVNKLLGYDNTKSAFESVKNNPFSVIILDEIDKVNTSVLNLLYKILDEGKLVDYNGDTIYFDNCIILMTTNISTNTIGFNETSNKLKEYFSTSFIDRIDSIIELNTLDRDSIKTIINNNLINLRKKYKNVRICIGNKTIDNIIKLSNYEELGARNIYKLINTYIDNKILDDILLDNKTINIKSMS